MPRQLLVRSPKVRNKITTLAHDASIVEPRAALPGNGQAVAEAEAVAEGIKVKGRLAQRLQVAGAVLNEGPRVCGKTATARQAAAREVLLDVDENAGRSAFPAGLWHYGPCVRR